MMIIMILMIITCNILYERETYIYIYIYIYTYTLVYAPGAEPAGCDLGCGTGGAGKGKKGGGAKGGIQVVNILIS